MQTHDDVHPVNASRLVMRLETRVGVHVHVLGRQDEGLVTVGTRVAQGHLLEIPLGKEGRAANGPLRMMHI